ncbi:MAG: hypothetical protein P1U80_05275 [Pseudomonadales bacterium]|nr:hypothetical protein [Pseudomonadales bacterium]
MGDILNITNGDSAVEIMKKAGIPGKFLPWKDVLHDGPVPKGLGLEELSKIRAEFIIGRGWGEPENIRRDFIERDDTLKSFREYEKVILWFEHDLYDQLQILQILDWFHDKDKNGVELSIICRDKYLGMLSPGEMKNLLIFEEPITEKHLVLSSKAWSAFRENSPKEWCQLLDKDISVLPYLKGAVTRMLEEYPNSDNGLSRTEQQALKIISKGESLAGKVFGLSQKSEERMFLGDSSFWVLLQEFIDSSPELLTLREGTKLAYPTARDQELTITPVGLDVLYGKRHWLDIKDYDRWIGGVHLEHGSVWCWES